MRIAQLATNIECVPPKGYGGTESVVHLLTEELVRRGHEVTLFATGDSQTAARLIHSVEAPLRTDALIPQSRWAAYDLRTLLQLKNMSAEFDIIHNHMGYVALPFLSEIDCASVTTNHNPIKDYCAEIYLHYRQLPYVSISNAYARLNYADKLNYVATVYNGIDVDSFAGQRAKQGQYLLFIGRIGYDKGTAAALDIAHALSLPIKLAGKVDKRDMDYFEAEVKPRLCYKEAEFIGEVNHEQKIDLYRSAIATVCPINFDEPFGLVLAESMAAGTPVMAFNRGAVPEVVQDKVTGIVGGSVNELVCRFPELERITASACQARSRSLFSVKQMVDGYEEVYKKLMDKRAG